MQYRRLKKGEIIQKGDQCDQPTNWKKYKPNWVNVVANIGEPAPTPAWRSNGRYRRPVYPPEYQVWLEAMRRKKVNWEAVFYIRNCLLSENDVAPGQAAAVIDYLLEVIDELRDSLAMIR